MDTQLQSTDQREVDNPPVLTPDNIAEMLRARHEHQVTKFRTTCSDCVPNL